MLIEKGADINIANVHDKTPLDIAKAKGHTEIYQILVEAQQKKGEAAETSAVGMLASTATASLYT